MLIRELEYRLRTNDFDTYDHITMTSILNSFQDIAGVHAEELGIGFETMVKKNYYWVVTKVKATVLETPKPGDVITVKTWPLPKAKIEFRREYEITNKDGKVIAYGSSIWVLITCDTRRLSRGQDVNYEGECYNKIYYSELPKLKFELTNPSIYTHEVKFVDLDHNGHMNNSRYADIILNIIGLNNKHIKEIQFDYLIEAKYHDILTIKYEKNDNIYNFIAYNNDRVCLKCQAEVEDNE